MCAVYKALINRTAIIIVEKWHIAASALHNAAYPSRSVLLAANLSLTNFEFRKILFGEGSIYVKPGYTCSTSLMTCSW